MSDSALPVQVMMTERATRDMQSCKCTNMMAAQDSCGEITSETEYWTQQEYMIGAETWRQ